MFGKLLMLLILNMLKVIGLLMFNRLMHNLLDMYILLSLSVDEKLGLIAKLTNSIRNTHKNESDIATEDPFACYKSEWGEVMLAEKNLR